MADNLTTQTTVATPPSGSVIGTRQVTYSGDSCHIAPVGLVAFSGADDAKTATDIPGDAANGLDVDVTRVSGNVTVVQSTATNLKVDASGVAVPVTDNGSTLSIDDGAGSITIDGTVGVSGTVTVDSELTTADLDTGAGTDTRAVVGLVLAASGGGLLVGAANPVPVSDNAGSLTVDGTVAATQSGSWSLAANQSVNVAQINGVTPLMGAGNTGTGSHRVTIASDQAAVATTPAGNVAHDGVDSGNPVKVGFKAETSPKAITLVADGDRTDAYADADGILMVKLNTSGADIISERVTNTDGASTAFTNFSAVASTKNYITGITVFRSDAGTTMASVDFRDGTAGSVLWTMPLPPNGGSTESWAVPAFHTSANTALAFDVSAALTTVTINVTGFQSKV